MLKKRSEYLYYDIAALVFGAAFFTFAVLTARLSVGIPDETSYITGAQRLLMGDRLFAEEWMAPQLSYLFTLLPYRLYTKLTGGTEGVLLFMRYVFLFLYAAFYAYAYCRLRRYRLRGLVSAALFCVVFPYTMTSLFYYSVADMLAMLACLMLLPEPTPPKAPRLVAAGVVIAFAVLAEPFLVFAYAFYGCLTLAARLKKLSFLKERFGFLLDLRTFLFLSLGAFAVFVAFMSYLYACGSLALLPQMLPHIFSGPEYNKSNLLDGNKYLEAVELFGPVNLILLLAAVLGAFVYAVTRKKNRTARAALFAAACIAMGLCLVSGIRNDTQNEFLPVLFHELPGLVFSLALWLLCDKKSDRLLALWCAGVLFSVCVDAASSASVASGGKLAQTAGVFCFITLVQEIRADYRPELAKPKRLSAPAKRALAAWGAAALFCVLSLAVWTADFVRVETVDKLYERVFVWDKESPMNEKVTRGPYKGLLTTAQVKDGYEAILTDLDRIKDAESTGPLFVMGQFPYAYLYLEMPYASYNAWYSGSLDRVIEYWRVFPEKRPDYVYIPFIDYRSKYLNDIQELTDSLTVLFTDSKVIRGKAGVIVEVTGALDLPDPE